MRISGSGRRLPTPVAGLVAGLFVVLAPAGAVERGSQSVTSQFDPEATAAHPKTHTLAVVLAEDHAEGARVCASYSHARSKKPNRGKVNVVLRVLRSGPALPHGDPVLTHRFRRSRVRDGAALVCVGIDVPLAAGDWVVLDYELRGRPAIRGEGGEAAVLVGQVTPP